MMTGLGLGVGGVLMMGAWILFWVFMVAGLVWVVSALARSQERLGDDASAALRILQERLARGDIDAEEFRMRRTALDDAVR